MISDQKHKCEKAANFGTNDFADKRVEINQVAQIIAIRMYNVFQLI